MDEEAVGELERHGTSASDVGCWSKGFCIHYAVVGSFWLVQHGETVCVDGPVELSAVDDHAANCGAMAADVFGQRVHDKVRPKFQGANAEG